MNRHAAAHPDDWQERLEAALDSEPRHLATEQDEDREVEE